MSVKIQFDIASVKAAEIVYFLRNDFRLAAIYLKKIASYIQIGGKRSSQKKRKDNVSVI